MTGPQKAAAIAFGMVMFLFWVSGASLFDRSPWHTFVWAAAIFVAWGAHEVKAGRL